MTRSPSPIRRDPTATMFAVVLMAIALVGTAAAIVLPIIG